MFNYAIRAGPFTKTDGLTLGQNENGLKTDKNATARKLNGNGTELPVPLYRREMGTFFDTYHIYMPSVPRELKLNYIHTLRLRDTVEGVVLSVDFTIRR